MELKTRSFYDYGPFRLDPAEHRLTREGTPVSLAPKAFELLLFLVRNPGRLLTKDQIMQAVCTGSFVEDANLTVAISLLRMVLGEKEGNLRYIETVPKKGYRFIASVQEVQCAHAVLAKPDGDSLREAPVLEVQPGFTGPPLAHAPPVVQNGEQNRVRGGPHWTRIAIYALLLVGLLLAAAGYLAHRKQATLSLRLAPVQRSLAILPLRNLRQNPNDDFLGFALADAVITKLEPVSSLTVRPSSAMRNIRGRRLTREKLPRI